MGPDQIKHVHNDLIKSAEDKRLYRGLELTNGMKVLLVSDSTTDKSSAAMDVHIGSMSDPEKLPGLAHFCEHMLFMGTEKYPSENEYDKFLSEHGGSTNAFTSLEHTNYYFDVGPHHLQGALDRFAQFFLGPLFTESGTEREVNAVNSENARNLRNDGWRLDQLERATCDPTHDYAKFNIGNKESLLTSPQKEGIDVREELLKFHREYYSANIMSLAVLGKESLDELEAMILPLFDAVENKNVSVPEWIQHPLGAVQLKLQYQMVPVKDKRNLKVTWPIPDLHPHYKTAPGRYLGHLIGHEGKGSLFSLLKSKGWVNTLYGGQQHGARGFMFFIVDVDLTEEGMEHTDDIVAMVFQYLKMLRREQPQKWVFEECRDLNAVKFQFKGKERPREYTSDLAGRMHDYEMKEVLCGGYFANDYKPELIDMILETLTPEQMRIMVIGKKFEGKTDKTEKWYGTQYSVAPIPEDTVQNWKNVPLNEDFHLPPPNEFIATTFDLVEREEDASELPQVLHTGDMTRLWFKQDDSFKLPKACIGIDIASPFAYIDPLCGNLNYMFVSLLKDALNENIYDANLAGIGYSLTSSVYGLSLNFSGFNDKQHILMERFITKIATLNIDRKRFDTLKESYIQELKNFKAEQPHAHAMYYTSVLVSEQTWTNEELLRATDEMTVEKLERFVPQLLSKLFLEILVYGNVTKQHARKLMETVENTLRKNAGTKPFPVSQHRRFREVQLPDGSSYVYTRKNSVHKSSSLEVFYQCNIRETSNNMVLELFTQIIQEPCFNILRTQEQLGYITFSNIRRSDGVQGLRVVVQSDRSPQYVEARVEAFLLKMQTHIKDMDTVTFQNHVEALATKRQEKPKNLSSQNNKYWGEIESQQYNFDRDNIEVAYLRTLTKDDVLKFYQEFIAYNAPRRHKMCVHIMPEADVSCDDVTDTEQTQTERKADDVPLLKKAVAVTDVPAFKKELGLFPLPRPFVPIAEQ